MSNGHVVSYEEAIKYFVNHRPKDPRVVKGALLREKSGDKYVLISVFLDKNNEMVSDEKGAPHGRKIKARSFDEELERAFGDKAMIIIE